MGMTWIEKLATKESLEAAISKTESPDELTVALAEINQFGGALEPLLEWKTFVATHLALLQVLGMRAVEAIALERLPLRRESCQATGRGGSA